MLGHELLPEVEQPLAPANLHELNDEQRRASGIVIQHLDQSQTQDGLPPLYMIVEGKCGTGKSRAIQIITEAFAYRGLEHILVKSGYTSIAALLINGKTTQSVAGIAAGRRGGAKSDKTKNRLENFWRDKRYLIIDEYSMIGRSFLAQLSRHINSAKGVEDKGNIIFGNVSVILCGDFHQFLPIGIPPREALYCRTEDTDPKDQQIGRTIYERFITVVKFRP